MFSSPHVPRRAARPPTRHSAIPQEVTGTLLGVLDLLTPRAPRLATPRITSFTDTPSRVRPAHRLTRSVYFDQVGCHASRSMRPKDLPKEGPCQVALGKLEDVVPSMLDEAPPSLEGG